MGARLTTIEENPRDGRSANRMSSRLELEKLRLELQRLDANILSILCETSSSSKSRSRSNTSSAARDPASSETRQRLAIVEAQLTAKDERLSYLERHHKDAAQKRKAELSIIIRKAQALDLAFLVDATGSMQDCIAMVKDEVASVAEGIAEAHPQSKLRVAFAPYRDYDDPPEKSCDFTTSFRGDSSVFVRALSEVKASGGADAPEDIFSGLEDVAKLSWQAANRVLIHIGDAPCHGRRFHDGAGDSYPDGDKRLRDIGHILRTLRDRCKISSYTFCHLNQSTKKMVREFQKEVEGGWIQEELFDNISDIPLKVVAVSKETISSTLSCLGKTQSGPDKYVLETVQPGIPGEWKEIPARNAQQLRGKFYDSLDHLLERLASGKNLELEPMPTVYVQIAPHPFSGNGAVRWPYYAQVTNVSAGTSFPMVVKRFKVPLAAKSSDVHRKDRYLEQMEVQTVSAQMAREFNKKTKNLVGAKQVTFSMVTTLQMEGASGEPCLFYNMEKFLKGSWIKYSNNAGYVNTADYAATLQAFSHWTHERSQGQLMVTDLQGVRMQSSSTGENEFWLCDPAIHSKDVMRFTSTNLGEAGFELFYKTHSCNDVRRALTLTPGMNAYTQSSTMPALAC